MMMNGVEETSTTWTPGIVYFRNAKDGSKKVEGKTSERSIIYIKGSNREKDCVV